MARGPRTPGIGSMEQAAAGRAQHHHACTSTDHPQDRWTADMAARASQCGPLSGSRQGKDESSSAPKRIHIRDWAPAVVWDAFFFPLHSFFSMDTKGRERAALPEYKLYPTWTWQTQMLHLGSSPRPTDQTIEPEMFAASDQYDGRVAPTASFESRRSDGTSPYTVPHPAQVDIRSPSTFVGI